MVKKKKSIQEVTTVTEPIAVEETTYENDLRTNLEEIKNCDGVIGYILRNSSSASIDLKDPTRIIDFAILSSSTFDAIRDFSELFDLGDVNHAIVEGQKVKILSIAIDENKISVFMEKNADAEKILKKMHMT